MPVPGSENPSSASDRRGGKTGAAGMLAIPGSLAIFLIAAVLGLFCFGYYYQQGMTVAHYDAKAHLVVARSVFDSLSPGYLQLGTHWLPLTHLLYLPFVWLDSQYRSGFLPSLLSVFCFALSAGLACRVAHYVSGSMRAGIFAGLFLIANANLQYLQSCPLTEPISMALMLLAMDGILRWRDRAQGSLPWLPAIWAALSALCRYEGWYFLGGILLLLAFDFLTRRMPRQLAVRGMCTYAGLFAIPISLHFGYLYSRIGDNFLIRVAQGNPAPFETYQRPFLSLLYHAAELAQIAGGVPLFAGLAGVLFCIQRKDRLQRCLPLFLLWLPSLINLSALYWGMIYRIRYAVLLIPALAIFAGVLSASKCASARVLLSGSMLAAGLPWLSWILPHEWQYRGFYEGPGFLLLPALVALLFCYAQARERYQWPLLILCILAMQSPVLQGEHRPILAETTENGFIEGDRGQVLDFLRRNYDGSRILIDAQKLSPLMYDSRLPIREFIYNEGDLSRWRRAVAAPEHDSGWICIQKGDELSGRLQVDPHLIDEYSLVVQNDWFSLYRLTRIRQAAPQDRRIP